MKMKLAFYKAKGNWKDKLIRFWTKGPYSHVEIVSEDGYMYSSSPRDNGVRKKKHTYDPKKWDYVEVEINPKILEEFYEETKGEHYDLAGILGFVIPVKDRTNRWFCSEWCSNVLKISGHKAMWKQEPSKISPNRLYKLLKNF